MNDQIGGKTAAMGERVLHPTHPLFRQFKHPACPVCRCEILPMTAIDSEKLPDGRTLWMHAACYQETTSNEPKEA